MDPLPPASLDPEDAAPLGSMFSPPRHRHSFSMRAPSDPSPDEEPDIDFTAAGLYVVGLQVILATMACCIVSVASCWLMPAAAISAVRTVALTSFVGGIAVFKPLRIGRVRGVATIFNALRPCVPLYVLALVVEQLLHTCVNDDSLHSGAWRSFVFHAMSLVMLASGLLRAVKPRSETDLPFLVTGAALLVVALLPPPPHALTGPLCEPATLLRAGERLLRAVLFCSLYVTQVYCSAPSRNAINELSVCIIRAAAAAVWSLAAHSIFLALAPVQAILALWARFGSGPPGKYDAIETQSDDGDAEMGLLMASLADDPVKQSALLLAQPPYELQADSGSSPFEAKSAATDTAPPEPTQETPIDVATLATIGSRATQKNVAKSLSRATGGMFQLEVKKTLAAS